MIKTSILLLSTERSGTNLLRAIMSTHSQISSPPPFSMIDVMSVSPYRYLGDGEEDYFEVLIDDAIKLTKTHLNPWDIELNVDDIKSKVQSRSFWELFKVLNEQYAESENKSYWFSKEAGLFRFIYPLAMHIPQAKFIYMVRDPRDVVASMLDGGMHEHNAYVAARRWRDEQVSCLNALRDPLISNRIFKIHYEDLLKDSESTVSALMDFLCVPFERQQLEFYKNEKIIAHSTKSNFWRNLNRPIDQNNKGNYLSKLSKRQIAIIENVCWNEMHALGYSKTIATLKTISLHTRLYYIADSYFKKFLKQFKFSKEGKKHINRRKATIEIRDRKFF